MNAVKTARVEDGAFGTELEHGLVAPLGTPPGGQREVLHTRTYRHPGLPEELPVVRLAADSLAAAQDAAMANLGFGAPVECLAVGVVHPRAPRFPETLLVHAPAHYPLGVSLVKELRALTKFAGRKPARARTEVEALAARLEAASPKALPGFYEEAARMFLGAARAGAASALFAKAREAEREHSVPRDDESAFRLHLEFAREGALSVAVLRAYLRELQGSCPPDVVYARFRRVSLERVVHGQVPQSDLPTVLRRLSAEAKADASAEALSLCFELLRSRAALRARAGFWKALRPELLAASEDPRIRGLLLAIMPQMPATPNPAGDALWLEILRECGTFPALTEQAESAPEPARPADGAAGWLGRFGGNMHRGRPWQSFGEPWRSFDPLTGELGEQARPEMFDRGFTGPELARRYGEAALVPGASSLFPLPEGVEASPLGQSGRLAGWRTVAGTGTAAGAAPDGGYQAGIGIDGREAESVRQLTPYHRDDRPAIVGAIRFPGAPAALPVVCHFYRLLTRTCKITVLAPDGAAQAFMKIGAVLEPGHALGTACVPPWQYWHYLRPRDAAGSAALRRITGEDVLRVVSALRGREGLEGIREAVALTLPEITHPGLIDGVCGYLAHTVHLAVTLSGFESSAEAEEPVEADAVPAPTPSTDSQESAAHEH